MKRYDVIDEIRRKHPPEESTQPRRKRTKKKKRKNVSRLTQEESYIRSSISSEKGIHEIVSYDMESIIIHSFCCMVDLLSFFQTYKTELNKSLKIGKLNFEQFC